MFLLLCAFYRSEVVYLGINVRVLSEPVGVTQKMEVSKSSQKEKTPLDSSFETIILCLMHTRVRTPYIF